MKRIIFVLLAMVMATAGVAAWSQISHAPHGTAAPGEGATERRIFSGKLPNVPGKTLTVVQVDYRPGGFSVPHRHPASGFVFAYVCLLKISSGDPGWSF